MLSGSFRSFPLSSITVAPDRQRKELTGIPELAESIRSLGLIHPVVVTPDGVLVAGERRLRAHQELGLTHITVQFTTDLPREELEAIELEENVKRKALHWREEVAAVTRLHQLKSGSDPDWTQADTAKLLSVSGATITNHLLLSSFVAAEEPLVLNADTYSTALNICLRKKQRAASDDVASVDAAFDEAFATPVSVAPISVKSGVAEAELPLIPASPRVIPYLNTGFIEWAEAPYTGPKFNFLHCDFPYGINYDKHNGGATGLLGGYADTPELYQSCLASLRLCMADRVAESAHLMFWLSARIEIVTATFTVLEEMGWKINPVPLIWHRSDNAGILPDPQRGPRQIYEVCLFGSRGDRKIVQAVSNLYAHPKTKEVHPSEKPRPMLQHFFRMFVDESTVMLDPTMGSGNSILTAEEASAKHVLGIEIDPEIFGNAVAYRNRVKRRD